MAIAKTNEFWNHRLNGDDPTSPSGQNNDAWTKTGTGASQTSDKWWQVTDAKYEVTPTTDAYTMFACIRYGTTDPDNGEVLMKLDNGTHKVEVQATGNIQTLNLVGATTVQTPYLDIKMLNDEPVPLILRLTLDADGNARLYMREIIEDDDGVTHFLSVTGATGVSKSIEWGNTTGTVDWASLYATTHGSFSPDELSPSDFVTNTHLRMALSIVELLKNSTRTYLKTHVDDSAIIYGYDLSANMLNRVTPPVIHVLMPALQSPEFQALGGGRVDQEYEVEVYITTRGTDYENAYRTCLNIAGDVFDEVYRNTGLQGTTDSLKSYDMVLKHKMDDDDTVCTHMLTFTYLRRINMRTR
jgi:hypothetical protein